MSLVVDSFTPSLTDNCTCGHIAGDHIAAPPHRCPRCDCKYFKSPGSVDPIIEGAANIAHEQWSGWMNYMFSKCRKLVLCNEKGEEETLMAIPQEFVDRWYRQVNTPYSKLPEKEKESDRIEALKYIEYLDSKRR